MPRTRRFIQAPTPALSDRKVKPATLWIMGGSFHGIKTKEKDQRSKDSQLDYFSNLLSYCISFLFFWLCWVFVAYMKESESEVAQSSPTFCDPMDCSLRGSPGHGIFQARILEWVAISFSRGSF